MKQYRTSVTRRATLTLTPMVAPFFANVGWTWFTFRISAQGLYMIVKTIEGLQKTPSSSATPQYTETFFWILKSVTIITSGPITILSILTTRSALWPSVIGDAQYVKFQFPVVLLWLKSEYYFACWFHEDTKEACLPWLGVIKHGHFYVSHYN